jgi:hypothetical protein
MITIKLEMNEKQLESFNEMCRLTGEDRETKLRMMITDELNLFWQKRKQRESRKKEGWVEVGVTHVFPLAY